MNRIENIIAPHIRWIENESHTISNPPLFLSPQKINQVLRFHTSVKGYTQTPLYCLPAFAKDLGVKAVFVKDESSRFGLNAFKGLGGIYAVASLICKQLGMDISNITLNELLEPHIKKQIKDMVFITATDGNHGKGVAWAAKLFSCRAYVYMPKGTVQSRVDAIRKLGAEEVIVTDKNYDDTVRLAYSRAEKNGWYLIQDTAWEGYTEIPTSIVQGYSTLALEVYNQFQESNNNFPSHLFLQAGVGAYAGCILGCFANLYGDKLPITSIVEPENVACIYESVRRNDGKPHRAEGNGETIMAGLNCGEPCIITYPILRDYASFYIACSDSISQKGMQLLGNPLSNDTKIISGESGAVTAGLLSAITKDSNCTILKQRLKLDENSVILLISTEGATDPENYKKIMNKINL